MLALSILPASCFSLPVPVVFTSLLTSFWSLLKRYPLTILFNIDLLPRSLLWFIFALGPNV